MNVHKEAAQDAAEYARAQMFFGEGAGIRRNHIGKTVNYKAANKPGYRAAFEKSLESQDMVYHAKKARSERRRKDMEKSIEHNLRSLTKGDIGSMSTRFLMVVGVIVVAHHTGADRKAAEYAKFKFRQLKSKITKRRNINHIYNITNIRH